MITAAKEEMLSSFAPWCAETCIGASAGESKKPHQGFAGQNLILHRGMEWSKSTLALGLPEWSGKTVSGPAVAANNGPQQPQQPKSPARQQCEANAANKYQNTFNAVDKGFYPKAGKSALKGSLWGAAAGCAVTWEIGCAEGGLPGWLIGGLAGAGKSMWEDLGSVGMAYLQYRDEMNACTAIP
jgi:hypothetical protein